MMAAGRPCGVKLRRGDAVRLARELVPELVAWLDGSAFGPDAMERREACARVLARFGLYDLGPDEGEDDGPVRAVCAKSWHPSARRSDPDSAAETGTDWRTQEQRAADDALSGVWYRCSAHGVTGDPIILAGRAYCPAPDCGNQTLRVGRLAHGEW